MHVTDHAQDLVTSCSPQHASASTNLTPCVRSHAALLLHAPLTLLRALRWLSEQPGGQGLLADGACCTVHCVGVLTHCPGQFRYIVDCYWLVEVSRAAACSKMAPRPAWRRHLLG